MYFCFYCNKTNKVPAQISHLPNDFWFIAMKNSFENQPSLRKKKEFLKSTIFMWKITLQKVSKGFKKKLFYSVNKPYFSYVCFQEEKCKEFEKMRGTETRGAWVKAWIVQLKPQFSQCLGWPGFSDGLALLMGSPLSPIPIPAPTLQVLLQTQDVFWGWYEHNSAKNTSRTTGLWI